MTKYNTLFKQRVIEFYHSKW